MNIVFLFATCIALSFSGQTSAPSSAPTSAATDGDSFSIGLIADCQYADADTKNGRYYRLSPKKLGETVDTLNAHDLAFVMQLGDLIDRDAANYDTILPVLSGLKAPVHHVLGNHDFSVSDSYKDSVDERLGMPARYYDFAHRNWRFIVLDGNDLSLYAHPAGSEKDVQSKAWYERDGSQKKKYNGAVGEEQLAWLRGVLDKSQAANENVLIFCHFPIFPEDDINLWNAGELMALIEQYPHVRAWIAGHHHPGNYAERNGIHHLTCKGMVDTEESAASILTIRPDRLETVAFGRETPRQMLIKAQVLK